MSRRVHTKALGRFALLCCIVLAAVLQLGCGVARADDEVPTAREQTKESPARKREGKKRAQPTCDIFLVGELEGAIEYQAVYYDRQTGAVTALVDETCFARDAGFNRDQIDLIDVEDAFPGVGELSFVDVSTEWDDERISYVVRFEGLDDPAHIAELDEQGILYVDDRESDLPLDANSLMDRMIEQGATAVRAGEYEGLALSEEF